MTRPWLAQSRYVGGDLLHRFVEAAIRRYNRYRGAESRARLVKIVGDKVFVAFEGSFCATCGINDWVEDLKYVMEDLGGEAELLAIIEPENPEEFYDYRIGVFRVKKLPAPEHLEAIEREEKELDEWFSQS
jgi:class 3 adenylate cyclase